ncbi:YibE/F family protein [Rossellomorea vietnamensis]|uniref:YibE/F family protein n=1 Tax=Rossellomorea vietnamensis TaxID=218284 RepID=A0A6I6UQ30_9BACI|nr:YibE/F family protein [Rossellomorea vietnamensis]QHE60580.1 YibE/F family protein [Rossellomorea vietnamensis]
MTVQVWLTIILFALMVAVGGKKGARSFVALFLNTGVLLLTIIMMNDPDMNPIILTLVACILISCISLFYISEINIKTVTAFISTIVTTGALIFFILELTDAAMIQGFSEEETEEIGAFSLYVGVDFVKIGASMIIMSTIGAIIDVTISISSPMREIAYHNPDISRKDLFTSGIRLGRDILGTSANTLFFAFFGGYMGLLIWFKDLSYSIGDIVNSKVFTSEMIFIGSAGLGVALAIPVTSAITAYYLVKARQREKSPVHDESPIDK